MSYYPTPWNFKIIDYWRRSHWYQFASLYADLGCEVEIIEAMERVLPQMDRKFPRVLP